METEPQNSPTPPLPETLTLNPQSPPPPPLIDSPEVFLDSSDEISDTDNDEDDKIVNCSPINVNSSSQNSHLMVPPPPPWFQTNAFRNRNPPFVRKPVVVGAGLQNLGNTCFMNSVLQCFIHTVPLLRGILSDKWCCDCNKEAFCMRCSLRHLVRLSLTHTGDVVAPVGYFDNLSYISSNFEKFQQEDAHEFLQCFLDRLESCHDLKQKESDDNLVKQVFGGRLVSKLKCCNCGHCSDTYEPLIDMSLEIDDADNLVSALQSFTKVEKIEDPETKFTCEQCEEKVTIEKQLAFDQAPSVSAFHLKRFKHDGSFVEKIDKHVAFPLDLDLRPFTCSGKENNAELKYVLYAIVVHSGLTSTSGHYNCYIRLSPNVWGKFDDEKVFCVHEDFVLSQEAYILFYAKEGTPWFSNFTETQKLCVESNIRDRSPTSVLDSVDISPIQTNKINWDTIEANESSGSKPTVVFNISKDNLHRIPVSVAPAASNSDVSPVSVASAASNSDASLPEAQKQLSPTFVERVRMSQKSGAVGSSLNITPQTPTRSPSPEIYREDPPDAGIFIPRGHLKIIDRVSCKRRLEKEMDDSETKQARSLIKKTISGSRGQQLMAALRGSKTDDSMNRKKSRRLGYPLSPVVAGTYR